MVSEGSKVPYGLLSIPIQKTDSVLLGSWEKSKRRILMVLETENINYDKIVIK